MPASPTAKMAVLHTAWTKWIVQIYLSSILLVQCTPES